MVEQTQRDAWKNLIVITGGIVFIVVSITTSLIVNLFGEMREIVGQQFNEEQLIIAQNARNLIEREFDLVKKEIRLTAEKMSSASLGSETRNAILRESLGRVVENGVQQIEIVDLKKKQVQIYSISQRSPIAEKYKQEQYDYIDFRAEDDFAGILVQQDLKDYRHLSLTIKLNNQAEMYLHYLINVPWFLNPFLKKTRSGRTGYAWVINQKGTFLYHEDNSFIGKSAFRVRKEKDPDLSFEKINFIQKEKMLEGLEGSGYYSSGWHRGVTGRIEKFIAYTSIQISEKPVAKWSIAVVAPVFEIENQLRKVYVWQIALMVFIFALILLVAFMTLFFERRWSRLLELKVRQRTEELQRSEERNRLLVESAEDYIFSVDAELKLDSMNSYTAKFFGGLPSDFLGKDVISLFPSKEAATQINLMQTVLRRGKSVRSEMEWKTETGNVYVDANYMPLKNEAAEVNKVLCIARDITENKKIERNLINTEKLASLGTLAAGVAHEINNPMGVILGFVELLLQKFKTEKQTYEDLKIIERQGLHCKQVVENLLTFARTDETINEKCDLNRSLQEILRVVKHSLEIQNIELIESYGEDLPYVRGDSRKLQQVFLNLINNSTAAIANGGVIEISTYLDRRIRRIITEIRDTGGGISADDLKHIYEPFFTTKPAGEGTGLGLFVSYGIVAQFGGTIDCDSSQESRRKGATFTVKLKIWNEDE